VRALQMAITQRRPAPGLIVHSDRGTQFASAAFRNSSEGVRPLIVTRARSAGPRAGQN
jgi:transposase InsO family protein